MLKARFLEAPYYGTVYKMLTHPAYGGAYVYGRENNDGVYRWPPRHSHRKKPVPMAFPDSIITEGY